MYYFQRVEQKAKATARALRKCQTAQRWSKFGFRSATVNAAGECSGCRNPDDTALEPECRQCRYNEYHETK